MFSYYNLVDLTDPVDLLAFIVTVALAVLLIFPKN